MATLITETVQAYVNHGRWIAECCRPFCANAFRLRPHQTTFKCDGNGGCGKEAFIEWPPDADEIWEVLLLRPVPATRNWFPHGHKMVERFGYPGGQSPRDLIEEQEEMERLGE